MEPPLSRWLPCIACGHDHGGFLPCDQYPCVCSEHTLLGIDTALGG